jgi:hypothetical protein
MILSTGGFRQVVAFPPAPIATGWSDPCREGLAPSQEPCLSTAHDLITTTAELKFSVHTGSRRKRSWFGRWGVNHICGTAAVLPALKAVGEDMTQPFAHRKRSAEALQIVRAEFCEHRKKSQLLQGCSQWTTIRTT